MVYTITFEDAHLAKVLDGLSRFPFNQVHELMGHITDQVIVQQKAHAADEANQASSTVTDDLAEPSLIQVPRILTP